MRIHTGLVIVTGAFAVMVSAPLPALAATPAQQPINVVETNVVEGLCAFPITVTGTLTGTQTTFTNSAGQVQRLQYHLTEQDVWSANGVTLTSLPYRFNAEFLFNSDGTLLHEYTSGDGLKLPLPDGTVFHTAGRIDFVGHPGQGFVLVPDHGTPVDPAPLCAALSG